MGPTATDPAQSGLNPSTDVHAPRPAAPVMDVTPPRPVETSDVTPEPAQTVPAAAPANDLPQVAIEPQSSIEASPPESAPGGDAPDDLLAAELEQKEHHNEAQQPPQQQPPTDNSVMYAIITTIVIVFILAILAVFAYTTSK